MIKIKIDGVEHKIEPQLTVEKYQVISKNPKKYEDQSEILSLYLDISADELKDLPVDQIAFIDKLLEFLLRVALDQLCYWSWHCYLVFPNVMIKIFCSHDPCNTDKLVIVV